MCGVHANWSGSRSTASALRQEKVCVGWEAPALQTPIRGFGRRGWPLAREGGDPGGPTLHIVGYPMGGEGLLGVVGQGPPHCGELSPGSNAGPGPGAFTPAWHWAFNCGLLCGGGWGVDCGGPPCATPRLDLPYVCDDAACRIAAKNAAKCVCVYV